MKLIYGEKYTAAECKQIIPTIYSNVLQAIKVLAEQAVTYNMTGEILAKEQFQMIRDIDENQPINVTIGDAIKTLWLDPGIQKVWGKRAEFQLIESVKYYFNKIDVIKQPDYLPDQDDILYSRVRTSGIVTERYIINKDVFEMYDVGGQRNERKKWIHCFENVTAVIFVAALSEYDQKLFEDATQNRMDEAITLFDEICNNVFFENSSLILFLNKRDLFEEKIKTKSIKASPSFADYNGADGDYQSGVNYFLKKFLDKNKNKDREVYYHVTCATDTSNVKVVFDACKDIILRSNLKDSGFMD